MSKLLALTPYALVFATLAYGLIDVVKDWEDYKKSWLKISAIVGLVLIAVFTVVSLRQDAHDAQDQKAEMKRLEGESEASNTAQRENTALYVSSFKDLSGQLANLRTQVRTDTLQRRIVTLQTDLENTQKALTVPRTHLDFSFDPPRLSADGNTSIPVSETMAPVGTDNIMHVKFDILNLTNIDADEGEFILVVCDQCKYAKEPDNSAKPANTSDNQRNFPFARILADTKIGEAVDVLIPPYGRDIQLGYEYRCKTCVPSKLTRVTVHPQRAITHVPLK